MTQPQCQENLYLYAPVTDRVSLKCLNAFRELLGLGPSKNLISSSAGRSLHGPYGGNLDIPENNCAAIPDELNCRLWITGLPATCTHHQFLGSIRGIGPVYACHLTDPTQGGPKIWETAAASLTFFTADAANKFLARHAIDPFTVGGHKTKIIRHRIKTRGSAVNGRSRVLRIVGHPLIVDPEYLHRVITQEWGVRYDTDTMQHTPGAETSEIIWAFGSFRAQAHIIYGNINKYFMGHARAIYVADPCVQG